MLNLSVVILHKFLIDKGLVYSTNNNNVLIFLQVVLCEPSFQIVGKNCCSVELNENYVKTKQATFNVDSSLKNDKNTRKNIIFICRALLLLKTSWKLWYKYSKTIE